MGALEMGLTEDELPTLVSSWRESNSNIVNLWWCIDNAAKKVIKERSQDCVMASSFDISQDTDYHPTFWSNCIQARYRRESFWR